MSEDRGTVSEDRGTVSEDWGTVSWDRGTVSEDRGTVFWHILPRKLGDISTTRILARKLGAKVARGSQMTPK